VELADHPEAVAGSAPFPVAVAAVIALCKAAYLVLLGLLGFAVADQVADSWSGVILVAGLVYGLLGWLVLRRNRFARALLAAVSAVVLVAAVVYMFVGPSYAIVPSLVAAGAAFAVVALLYLPERSKAYFAHAKRV
jgi:hypothetical protein